jgi:Uma2 family endonuclease
MMSAAPQPRLSFDDWLAIERTSLEHRSEYVAGEVFAMAGGTEAHNLIVLNVGAELRAQLKGKDCRVYPSDMKVRIAADDVCTYPDVMVICGERWFYDDRRDVVTNPILIVEVLSDSTEGYDRGDKFLHYRSVASLQAYLLFSQQRMQAELFLRQPERHTSGDQSSPIADSARCAVALSPAAAATFSKAFQARERNPRRASRSRYPSRTAGQDRPVVSTSSERRMFRPSTSAA